MNADDVSIYLGLPHEPGAAGPDAYDCWNLLRHLRAAYFDAPLPDAPIGDKEACLALFTEKCRSGSWVPVAIPEHGDCACMRAGMNPHVGIYLDLDGGGILHSLERVGVIWTPTGSLHAHGFPKTTYYRIKK